MESAKLFNYLVEQNQKNRSLQTIDKKKFGKEKQFKQIDDLSYTEN